MESKSHETDGPATADRLVVTVVCTKRTKTAHRCDERCARRIAEASVRFATMVDSTPSEGGTGSTPNRHHDEELVSQIAEGLGLGVPERGRLLGQHQVGTASIETSSRVVVDDVPYGGTVEVWAHGSFWEAFAAAGRAASPVQKARYAGLGQFVVATATVTLYGELAASEG